MNSYFKISSVFLFLFLNLKILGQSYTISGYVTDANTRETLIGATIQLKDQIKAVVTDNNGFFSLPGVKPGKYTLIFTHIGYEKKEKGIILESKGLVLKEIRLSPTPYKLSEVSIIAVKTDEVADKSIETSHIELTPQMIQSIPSASNDIFAAVKFMPGIDRTESFSPLYTVRGGDPGENAVMLDGVMIYNPYHSSASSGIFNTLTIKNVDLLVGGFGAEYGGRNSSVMYITTKDGNTNEFHGEIEPSTFQSKLFLEFPAGKDASMMIAGRYFFDIPSNFIFNSKNYFYDYNISYTKRLNNRNRITLKYFESKDYMGYNFKTFYKYLGNSFNTDIYNDFTLEQRNSWQNRAATVIHKAILTPRIYIRNQVYYSSHNSKNFSGLDIEMDFPDEETGDTVTLKWDSNNRLSSAITDISIKSNITLKIATTNELKIGAEYNNYGFNNTININEIDNGKFNRHPLLYSLFIEDKQEIRMFIIRPGIRLSNYRNQNWLYEPRLNISLGLPAGFRLKAAYGEYLQYIISMNTNEIEMSQIVDYYYPLWNKSPSKSIHYILGVEKSLFSTLKLSLDGYYKDMPLVYAFDLNNYYGFSNKLQSGNGNAYGIEVLLEGKIKKISGWISYSYARASRQYPNTLINKGEEFPFDYNRPHTFKGVMNYQITSNFAINSSFTYLSGTHRSIETTTQSYYYYDPVSNQTYYFPIWTTNEKNSAKMPPLINWDLSIKKRLLGGFGKQLATFLHANESYVTLTVRNLLFLYRNVEWYIPSSGLDGYYGKYIPFGSNYIPTVGASYTLKF